MPIDPPKLLLVWRTVARESRDAVICLLTLIALTVSGILAAHVTAPAGAATQASAEFLADTARTPVAMQDLALTAQQSDFSDFPDLAAELALLTQTGPPSTTDRHEFFEPAKPLVFGGSYDGLNPALDCLATAAWYEAGDDPAGQRSVIQVVLNRVSHRSFPKSVCAVVFQGSERVTGCQFSFTCDGSMHRRLPSQAAWERARKRALAALSGAVDPTVGQATHFHADYVAPVWASEMEPLAQVGAHKFYRWPGKRGSLLGFPAFAPEMARPSLSKLGADQARFDDIPDPPFVDPPFEPESELLTPQPQAVMAAIPPIEPGIGELALQPEAMTAAAPLIEPSIGELAPQPEALTAAALLIEPGIGELAPQPEVFAAAAPLIEPGIEALALQPAEVIAVTVAPIEPGIEALAPQPEAVMAVAALPIEPGIEALAPQPQAVMAAASAPSASGTMFLEVTGEAKAGRWALDALARCEGRSACQVVGYGSAEQIDSNRLKPAEARDRPAFLFLRDPVSKMDVALWDCEQVTRSDVKECLPTSGAALDQLMLEPAREAIPTAGQSPQASLTTERTELAH
jgi:Cell Wall Hydrolase